MNIETKLEQLREQWKAQPQNRKSIELLVKMIKQAPENIEAEDPFTKQVKESLF